MSADHSLHDQILHAIDLMKSEKSFKRQLNAINQDNEAIHRWVREYGRSSFDNYQIICADSLFNWVLCQLQYEIENEECVINPEYILNILLNKMESSEEWFYVCDFNDAIVVYHGYPGGMYEVYSDLRIYKNIDEFFSVATFSGFLFPSSIHSEDEILSMFLKHIVSSTKS